MAQRWWSAMFVRGAVVLVPVLVLAIVIQDTIWGMLLLWWLKPLYERPPLRYLSNAVFGEPSSPREMLRGIVDSPMFVSLTWGRFSWRRSAIAAITLEDGTHADLVERKRTLYDDGAVFLMWPAVLGLIFEIGVAILLYQLIAGFFETSQGFVVGGDDFFTTISFLPVGLSQAIDAMNFWEISGFLTIYSVIILIVMPFFVASGFSLYLNQRTSLEGWDIEVGFNKLIQRLGLLLLLLCVWQPLEVRAEVVKDHTTAIEEVRNLPDFNESSTVKMPSVLKRFLEWLASDGDVEEEGDSAIGEIFAVVAEVIFWMAMFALLVYFIYRIATLVDFPGLTTVRRTPRSTKTATQVDELTRLPQDILAAASRAWQANDSRGAYSLLYLGAIRYLRDELECKIGKDETEAECLRRTGHLTPDLHQAFRGITLHWQRVAYAGGKVLQNQFAESSEIFRQFFTSK